ncbi:MAG: hypothetical protein BroJett018_19790 [Chloroflexota bacterium]|nr:SdpI family protein [Chloroflexota bacterium]NOG62491.1 SdpI family protein [Chloroflexota bacterium]GIK64185.1 MAG: hypothetical protein BroJett018_19790 [Chloroflexota bacterium]
MTLLGVMFVGMGLLLVALAIPLMQRRIKPNAWYGFRTPSTLRDPDLWYDANAYSGRLLLVYGAVIVITALLVALIPDITVDGYSSVMLIVTLLGIVILLILCWNFLRTYPYKDKTRS